MARRLRVEFPDAIYHLINRGDRREDIFRDDRDRHWFLETLGETCAKTGWQVHAFCLIKPIRRGWCFGEETFRKELLAEMAEKVGTSHYGAEAQESAEEKANRIVAEELGRRKRKESDLMTKRKGEPWKVEIARRLRAETAMTLKWIAQRLGMGTKTHLAHLLYWSSRTGQAARR